MQGRAEKKPLYHKIMQILRGEIIAGRYNERGTLPSEGSLETRFEVSRITVRRAIAELERQGMLVRAQGRAAQIVPYTPPTVVDVTQEIEGLRSHGRDMQVKVLEFAMVQPPTDVTEVLDLQAADNALRITRLRLRHGAPIVRTTVYMAKRFHALIDPKALETTQLIDILREKGHVAVSAEQTLSAAPCPDDLAPLLDLAPRAPIFQISRLVFGAHDKPLLLLRSSFRWDSYSYRMSLRQQADSQSLNAHRSRDILEDIVQG